MPHVLASSGHRLYILPHALSLFFFFFNDTATTEIYTLSLHDALPISARRGPSQRHRREPGRPASWREGCSGSGRSEEHTSELQSPDHLVCRLLLEKKKKNSTKRLMPVTPTRPTRPAHAGQLGVNCQTT